MQKWEYKVLKGWPTEVELNRLGSEGWELVSVTAASKYGYTGEQTVAAHLKRLILD